MFVRQWLDMTFAFGRSFPKMSHTSPEATHSQHCKPAQLRDRLFARADCFFSDLTHAFNFFDVNKSSMHVPKNMKDIKCVLHGH